jgi:hypothetical protein
MSYNPSGNGAPSARPVETPGVNSEPANAPVGAHSINIPDANAKSLKWRAIFLPLDSYICYR